MVTASRSGISVTGWQQCRGVATASRGSIGWQQCHGMGTASQDVATASRDVATASRDGTTNESANNGQCLRPGTEAAVSAPRSNHCPRGLFIVVVVHCCGCWPTVTPGCRTMLETRPLTEMSEQQAPWALLASLADRPEGRQGGQAT